MAPRIERVWGAIFGQTAVKRKESADSESSPQYQEKQKEHGAGGQSDKHPSEKAETRPADRGSVEKAIIDLRATDSFNQTGLKIDILESKDGLQVRLTDANGSAVRILSAEEFLRMRSNSAADQTQRGKILDQKY